MIGTLIDFLWDSIATLEVSWALTICPNNFTSCYLPN